MVPPFGVAALSFLALCSQRPQTALLVPVLVSFPFLGSGTFHKIIQVPVGAGCSFFSLFATCIFKRTGHLLD